MFVSKVEASQECDLSTGTVITLRACPFCGSSAVYESYGTTEYGDKCFSIGCANCGAKGPVYGHLKTTMDDAIDAWNDRKVVE